MASWTAQPPQNFDIVTGFFPEKRPKLNWSDNPRPLLVAGVLRSRRTGIPWVRCAYGTSRIRKVSGIQLVIENMSALDELCLPRPTAFVISPGSQWAWLPWTDEHFAPWTGRKTPILSRLPRDMRDFVEAEMRFLQDLPPRP